MATVTGIGGACSGPKDGVYIPVLEKKLAPHTKPKGTIICAPTAPVTFISNVKDPTSRRDDNIPLFVSTPMGELIEEEKLALALKGHYGYGLGGASGLSGELYFRRSSRYFICSLDSLSYRIILTFAFS